VRWTSGSRLRRSACSAILENLSEFDASNQVTNVMGRELTGYNALVDNRE
jgi:hypothetical protein